MRRQPRKSDMAILRLVKPKLKKLTPAQEKALAVVQGLNDANSPMHMQRRVFGGVSARRSNRTGEYEVQSSVGDALAREGLLLKMYMGSGIHAYAITDAGRVALSRGKRTKMSRTR
jgi:hypothetical protein